MAAAAGRLAGTRGAILCFHGLDVDGSPSPSSMHISLRHLEEIIECIKGVGRVVPLQELAVRHVGGRSTAGLVALTADDAYASWLGAEPLLARLEVSLTFFAVSGALEAGSRFWWDRIEDAAAVATPARWRRFEDDCGLPEAFRRGHPASEGVVRALRQWLLAGHAGRWPDSLDEPLERLEEEAGRRTSQRSMTGEELAGFLACTGSDVGVHTASHAALPFLSNDELVQEIRRGHEQLRARFPNVLPYLAIPFGLFEARTLRLAAEAGMAASLTLESHPLDRPFANAIGVPRLCVVREQKPALLTLRASGLARLIEGFRGNAHGPYPVLPSPAT